MFVVVATLEWVYRPRGAALDRYMRADDEGEGQNRTEIALEDLDGFSVNEAHGEMRQWHEGMELPLEPLLISSRDQMRNGLINREAPQSGYTTVDA
jgi:hypothetical protein